MTSAGGPGRAVRDAARLAAILFVTGCAKEEAPPGALPDTRPPQVVRTEPADDSVVPGFHGDLHIQFDEPINPAQGLERMLRGSPAYRYRLGAGFSDLKIHPENGWRPGAVYVIEVPSGIPDLLGNRTADPIRVVFSTGPPILPTRVTGRILDRITGAKVRDARVLFDHAGDTVPYTAVSDTGGRFSLPSLPRGAYRAYGFRDLNQDMELQRRLEAYDSARFDLPDSSSSAQVTFRLTEPDSTLPRLLLATALDSVTLELRFDDYLDPVQPFDSVRVTVRDTTTGTTWPVSGVEPEPKGGVAGPGGTGAGTGVSAPGGAAADTTVSGGVAADTAAPGGPAADTAVSGGAAVDTAAPGGAVADTGRLPTPDTGRARADSVAGGDGLAARPRSRPALPDSSALPVQRVLARLGRPLAPGTYRVRVEDIRNLRGLVGGGDTLFVYPRSDSAAAGGAGG